MTGLRYPRTREVEVFDEYHGTRIRDPYRWLEDLDAAETRAWIAEQNALTEAYLARQPVREYFRTTIERHWNVRRTELPIVEGSRVFYRMNAGLDPQAALFMRASLNADPVLLIDPNAIWPDGRTCLADFSPSPDARLLAYAISEGGADWQTLRIRDIEGGRDLEDEIRWVRFSTVSWTFDSGGFFYCRYPEPPPSRVLEAPLIAHAVYYHRLDTSQSDDALIFTNTEDPSWFVGADVTEDGRYLLITTSKGADNTNRLYRARLGDPRRPEVTAHLQPVFTNDGAECAPLGSDGDTLYVRTDLGAPNRRIARVDLEMTAAADGSAWQTVIPETENAIETAAVIGHRLVLEYLVDVTSRLSVFHLDGTYATDVPLPGLGSLAGLSGRADSTSFFYWFTSPLYPSTVFAHDLDANTTAALEPPDAPLDHTLYETTREFATAADGTRVPLFITARKGLERNGRNPLMLYGYGGFAVSLTPAYRADVPAWLDRGGIWVTASLRGGAEYGEAWHRAGMLERKQNVFDDFIAVAEHLIQGGYTSPDCLAIMGGSNGGLLVAAVMQQRPDLFAAVLPAVGVLDMLRYDRFTGGRAWATEYGSSSVADEFDVLRKYSPLHNVRPGICYPPTLITTADHDDRVVPSHSFKFAAAVQTAQGCGNPVLIRVETAGSHNFRTTANRIAELADEWTFAAVHTQGFAKAE